MLLSTVFAARLLGLVGYGELGVVLSTISMLSTIAGFSLGQMSTKYVAEFYQMDPGRAGRVISLSNLFSWITGAAMTIVLFLFANEIAAHALAAPYLGHQLRVASLLLLLGSITGTQVGTLYGFEAFRIIARINIITGVTSILAIVSGTWLFGLDGAIWGTIVSRIASYLAGEAALRRVTRSHGLPLKNPDRLREIGLVWRFGVPAMMAGVMVGPVIWISNAFIVNQPNGYAEMGIFNAANQLRQLILFFPTTLASVALPMLSNLQGIGGSRSYRKLFWANLGLSAGSAIIIALPIAVFAPWVMARFGASFRMGGSVLVLLCMAGVLTATLDGVGQSIASEGRMWFGFVLNLVWATVMLIVSYALRRHGAMGLGIATLFAYLVHLVTSSIYVRYRMSRW
jgi:O-antigen/teichoic acid export membrane protein